MSEFVAKSLAKMIDETPVFAEVLRRSFQRAADKGHAKCADFHCLAVLATDYTAATAEVRVLAGVAESNLDDAIWQVIKPLEPIPACTELSSRFWWMLHSIYADAETIRVGTPSLPH